MKIKQQDKIDALKIARNRIKSGQSRYICYALESVGVSSRHLKPACTALRKSIHNSLISVDGWGTGAYLKHCGSLEMWLFMDRSMHAAFRNNNQVKRKLTETRLAWIDAMIKSIETGEPVKDERK